MTHPTIDVLSERVAVVIQNRPVVSFSSWLADALRACTEAERGLQILTPAGSRLTMPLRLVLSGPNSRWVVRDPAGGFYDGLAGTVLAWDGSAFVPDGEVRLAPFFTREVVPGSCQVMVSATVRHPATETLCLGGIAEVLCRELTGAPPGGWGTSEPMGTPWQPEVLTALCRERAPGSTWIAFVGEPGAVHRAVGTVQVSRVTSGVEEAVTIVAGDYRDPPDARALAELVGRGFSLVTLLAQAAPGRADLTTEPRWTGLPAPLGMAIGAAALPEIDPAAVRASAGRPFGAGFWFELGSGRRPAEWENFTGLMEALHGPAGGPFR